MAQTPRKHPSSLSTRTIEFLRSILLTALVAAFTGANARAADGGSDEPLAETPASPAAQSPLAFASAPDAGAPPPTRAAAPAPPDIVLPVPPVPPVVPAPAPEPAPPAAEPTSASTLSAVVVTAQKREEKLQDVPVAITAVSGDTLVHSNAIKTAQDVIQYIPNASASSADGRTRPRWFLRGIGTNETRGFHRQPDWHLQR